MCAIGWGSDMADTIIRIGQSEIQHGKANDRVYLMKLSRADFPGVIDQIDQLAVQNGYTKIFAKVPAWAERGLEDRGYVVEARVPDFYDGQEDALFMARYPDPARKSRGDRETITQIVHTAMIAPKLDAPDLPKGFTCAVLTPEETPELAALYRAVFKSYPFPIFEAAYLKKTMTTHIVYFGIREGGRLVAASSCEMDVAHKNVEMTDFATLGDYRAKGFASFLLSQMEQEMRHRGILTAYTIARSMSYGMNITFAKNRYRFAGTLFNNTDISGEIESMNVWYKVLK